MIAAWYTADISFMDPAVAVNVVYGVKAKDDPEKFQELLDKVGRETGAYDLASRFLAQDVIDPRETRDWLSGMLEVHRRRPSAGVGEHLMRTWPYSF